MAWILGALLALAIAASAWTSVEHGRERTRQLELQLEDAREMRGDVRTMVEAATRQTASPVVFHPPAPRPSEGWFEGEPEVRVRGAE